MMTDELTREELRARVNKKGLDPAAVTVVGFMDLNPPKLNPDALFGLPADMYDVVVESFRVEREAWEANNVKLFGRPFPGHKCEHCGARLRWAGIVRYNPTGQHFVVGETCAEERMTLENRVEFDARLVKMAAEHRAEVLRRAEAKAAFYRDHAAEATYLFDEERPYDGFFDDLKRKLETYGELSEKQLACITRNVEREAAKQARIAEHQAQMINAPALTVGRHVIEGTVLSTKVVESAYGDQLKMLVELADGNRVYGSVPAKLESVWTPGEAPRLIDRGDVVRFSAAVEVSNDDTHFGFYKRPTKAEFISRASDTEEKS